jgi:uncharacterized protein YbjT (DUF2867 family)
MKVLLLGATGATGGLIEKLAIEKGIDLSVLVRNPGKLKPAISQIKIIKGDVLNADDVTKAVKNVNTVIWTIGGHDKVRRKKSDTNVNLCQTGTRNLIEAAKLNGAERIICVSSWGVADSYSRIPFLFKRLIFPMILKDELSDKAKQEELLQNSGLDYTIIRPSRLNNNTDNKELKVGFKLKYNHFNSTSREALARFVLTELLSPSFSKKIVEITQ